MNRAFSFDLNDDVVDSLRYFLKNVKEESEEIYIKGVYPSGNEKVFKLNKIMYKTKKHMRKRGKKYKRFIKPSNTLEYFFEGVILSES